MSASQPASPPRAARAAWVLLRDTFNTWMAHDAPSRGAALAFYSLVSMAPMLIVVMGVAGLWLGEDAVRGELYAQLRGLMGETGAVAVQALVQDARKPAQGWAGVAGGVLLMLVGATTVLAELQGTLDRLWQRPDEKPGSGLFHLLRGRLLGLGLIVGLAFLLLVSLVLSAGLAGLQRWWGGWMAAGSAPWSPWALGLLEALNHVGALAMATAVFALVYKVLPWARLQWRDVLAGALATAVLFSLGKALIGWYLSTSAVASSYGAAASLVVVLLWTYYSAQVFLLGAAFTRVWAGARRAMENGETGDTPVVLHGRARLADGRGHRAA